MNRKYCIFDMDGTLVNSMGCWHRLSREYLVSKGVEEDVTALLEEIKTMTVEESAALFLQRFQLPGTPQDVMRDMNGMMARHYRLDVPAKPGVREYLELLRERGAVMCIASATSEPLVRDCLHHLEMEPYFAFLMSCEEVGSGKSRPDVFQEAARRMGAKPSETAVFEDSAFAAQTAKNAGFYTVGVYDEDGRAEWPAVQRVCDETIRDWRDAARSEKLHSKCGKEELGTC
jgi:HAD superfamily hydrolase (TIGR01509 family)